MGRYTSYQKREGPIQRGQIHPVMRGIGCVLLVLVPLLSYGTAVLVVNYGTKKGWPIPLDWLGTPKIYSWLWKLAGLEKILNYLAAQTNLVANLVFAIAIAVVIFGILSILYGFMFSLMGPPQYGPTDVPPPRVKVRRYKR